MLDAVKRTMYAGLGLAAMTKEKADEFAKYLVETGELSQMQAEELLDEWRSQGKSLEQKIQASVDSAIRTTVEKMNLATKEDIYRLNLKLEELLARTGGATPTTGPAAGETKGPGAGAC